MAGNKAKAAIGKSQLATGQRKNTEPRTKPRKPRVKARRHTRDYDALEKVTSFPQVKGKVVREVRFTHRDLNNVLAIAFQDRTVLVFDIDPEPVVLPLGVRANYFGESRSARKTWEGLGE